MNLTDESRITQLIFLLIVKINPDVLYSHTALFMQMGLTHTVLFMQMGVTRERKRQELIERKRNNGTTEGGLKGVGTWGGSRMMMWQGKQ